jgi:hypothetical protein
MFGTTQFLRNWFMETEVVPNIPVYAQFIEIGSQFLKNQETSLS